MCRVTEDSQRPGDCSADGLSDAEDKADDRDEDKFITSTARFDLLVLEIFCVLQSASVCVRRILASHGILELDFSCLAAKVSLDNQRLSVNVSILHFELVYFLSGSQFG